MDYFENIVKRLIEEEGYWVRQSVKVNVTKEEKRLIGKHTIPRPEIDLVGYKPMENELIIIEAKSYLDSVGVNYKDLESTYLIPEGRYKLFTCKNYRDIVFNRLIQDFKQLGLVNESPKITFGLAVGNIKSKTEMQLVELFYKKGWKLYSPTDISNSIKILKDLPYDNDPYVIASKLMNK